MKLTNLQLKLFADFYSNMAVLWFGAAFISPIGVLSTFKFLMYGIFSLIFAMIFIKGVKEI